MTWRTLGWTLVAGLLALPALADPPPVASPSAGGQIDTLVPRTTGSTYRAVDSNAPRFSPLPPSRPCDAKNVIGQWVSAGVFEQAAGSPNADFKPLATATLQFDPNGTYSEARQGQAVAANSLNQYVVTNSGLLYYYRDSKVIASTACFIVASQQDIFLPGQMLHMPPAPTDGSLPSVRRVTVYKRPDRSLDVAPPVQPGFGR